MTTCLICGAQDKPCRCSIDIALEERTKEILDIPWQTFRTFQFVDVDELIDEIERRIKEKYGL